MLGLSPDISHVIDVHVFNPSSVIPQLSADNSRKVFANGAHVVICGLQCTCSFTIDVHNANPLSSNLQRELNDINFRKDFANGAHVVILS